MVDLIRPDDDELLNDFRVGVDFSVGARDFGEARTLVEQALQGENPDRLPLVVRDRLTLNLDPPM
nr:hypothetical protein GCM10023233_04030 [Brevibacterium otitidis]